MRTEFEAPPTDGADKERALAGKNSNNAADGPNIPSVLFPLKWK